MSLAFQLELDRSSYNLLCQISMPDKIQKNHRASWGLDRHLLIRSDDNEHLRNVAQRTTKESVQFVIILNGS